MICWSSDTLGITISFQILFKFDFSKSVLKFEGVILIV